MVPRTHRDTVGAVLWSLAASGPELPKAAGSDDVLSGVPGAPGVAEGSARIVRSPAEFDRIRPGDIVVCPVTQASWSPIFDVIGGLVTERGGPLSHPGTLAREYGLPCVLSVPGATTRLADDTVVRVDGASGTVTIQDAPVCQ